MNADDAQQAELPIPCGKSSVCTAASPETDVLDLPGSGVPMLAANFTSDSILLSITPQVDELPAGDYLFCWAKTSKCKD